MKKPSNYDDLNINSWMALTPGGHKCTILEAEETKSRSGLDMLIIYLDTSDDDKQAGYYRNRLLSDQEAGRIDDNLQQPGAWKKYWKCKHYMVTDESTDYGGDNLKRFNTSVLKSNGILNDEGKPDETKIEWDDKYCPWLKDKKVGVVFREEEYTKYDGSFGVVVKPMRFCTYDDAPEQKVPKIKLKEQPAAAPSEWVQQSLQLADEPFMQVDQLSDEGLPFR